MKKLITKRLVLRELKENDAPQVLALRSDPRVNEFLDRIPCSHLDEADHFIGMIRENMKKNDSFYWAITIDDLLIGTICFWNYIREKNKAEIGFELLPSHQRKGLMMEAVNAVIDFGFRELQLDTIEGYTDPLNKPSIILLEKAGFRMVENEEEKMRVFRLEKGKG